LRDLLAAGVSGAWLRPPSFYRRPPRPRPERSEKPGHLGSVGQRPGGRVLPRAGGPRGGPLGGKVRQPRPRQGGLRLAGLSVSYAATNQKTDGPPSVFLIRGR